MPAVPAMSYKIGVDGGGTKTECLLIDRQGRVVARHTGPGCNPSVIGQDQAAVIITAALDALRAQAVADFAQHHGPAGESQTLITHTLLCMAGHRGFWQELAATRTGFGRVTTTDDSLPVLELATHGQPGLVLHAGTGSFVAARAPDSSVHYAGGRGWRFDDPGSAYDLGQRAIARALLELQGWAPLSGLGPMVREHTGLSATTDASAVTRYFYQQTEPNRVIAALAPAVLRLASEHDSAAHELAAASAGELLDLAVTVATKLFSASQLGTLTAGVSGPILTHPVVHAALAARSPFMLVPVVGAPIEGVRQMLARI